MVFNISPKKFFDDDFQLNAKIYTDKDGTKKIHFFLCGENHSLDLNLNIKITDVRNAVFKKLPISDFFKFWKKKAYVKSNVKIIHEDVIIFKKGFVEIDDEHAKKVLGIKNLNGDITSFIKDKIKKDHPLKLAEMYESQWHKNNNPIDYEHALYWYKKVVTHDPKKAAEVYKNLGELHLSNKNIKEAMLAFFAANKEEKTKLSQLEEIFSNPIKKEKNLDKNKLNQIVNSFINLDEKELKSFTEEEKELFLNYCLREAIEQVNKKNDSASSFFHMAMKLSQKGNLDSNIRNFEKILNKLININQNDYPIVNKLIKEARDELSFFELNKGKLLLIDFKKYPLKFSLGKEAIQLFKNVAIRPGSTNNKKEAIAKINELAIKDSDAKIALAHVYRCHFEEIKMHLKNKSINLNEIDEIRIAMYQTKFWLEKANQEGNKEAKKELISILNTFGKEINDILQNRYLNIESSIKEILRKEAANFLTQASKLEDKANLKAYAKSKAEFDYIPKNFNGRTFDELSPSEELEIMANFAEVFCEARRAGEIDKETHCSFLELEIEHTWNTLLTPDVIASFDEDTMKAYQNMLKEKNERKVNKQVSYNWSYHFKVRLSVLVTPPDLRSDGFFERSGGKILLDNDNWKTHEATVKALANKGNLYFSGNKEPADIENVDYFLYPTCLGELDIEDMNKTFSTRLYPIGLIKKPVMADGEMMFPDKFLRHDHAHFKIIADETKKLSLNDFRKIDRKYRLMLEYFKKRGDELFPLSKELSQLLNATYFMLWHEYVRLEEIIKYERQPIGSLRQLLENFRIPEDHMSRSDWYKDLYPNFNSLNVSSNKEMILLGQDLMQILLQSKNIDEISEKMIIFKQALAKKQQEAQENPSIPDENNLFSSIIKIEKFNFNKEELNIYNEIVKAINASSLDEAIKMAANYPKVQRAFKLQKMTFNEGSQEYENLEK